MSNRSRVFVRFPPKKEHDLVARVETGIVVDTLRWIEQPITDEDDGPVDIGGRRVEHRQKFRPSVERQASLGEGQLQQEMVVDGPSRDGGGLFPFPLRERIGLIFRRGCEGAMESQFAESSGDESSRLRILRAAGLPASIRRSAQGHDVRQHPFGGDLFQGRRKPVVDRERRIQRRTGEDSGRQAGHDAETQHDCTARLHVPSDKNVWRSATYSIEREIRCRVQDGTIPCRATEQRECVWINNRASLFPIGSSRSRAPISGNTPGIPWTGIHGGRKPCRGRRRRTSRSCCRSATPPVIGAM